MIKSKLIYSTKISCTIIGLFFLSALRSSASKLSIRVFTDLKVSSLMVAPLFGEYQIYADNQLIAVDSNSTHALLLTVQDDSILVKSFEKEIGVFSAIRLTGKEYPSSFKIRTIAPNSDTKSFNDNLEVSVVNKNLKIINKVELEHYIGGVVECESGSKNKNEYFKLQAILCRTYALSNLRRHEVEGFNLCNLVHCQVYFNKSNNANIIEAVEETKGLVITDSDLNLITAAFHSNCGGETVNSEDAWTLPTSYLKSVIDTFCLSQSQATWQRKISKEDWVTYLTLKSKESPDSVNLNTTASFSLRGKREIFYKYKNQNIPLKVIRQDWKLKSTFFSIQDGADTVTLNGRGYGHGIGLCQEGAMQMANYGYSYNDIIHFYYKNVHLVDLSVLNFFREN